MDSGDQSISGLLCLESETCLEEEEEEKEVEVNQDIFNSINIDKNGCYGCFDLVKEEEYVGLLIEREMRLGLEKDQSLVINENWVKCSRMEAISWILKTRATFGFEYQTAYLSMTYFDRFLSKRSVDSDKSWAFRLLSIACLSLAAKMEEIRVPALREFQSDDYNFGSQFIQKMELLLLNTLEWRMISITPFKFLPFFLRKLCEDPPTRDMVTRISGFILAFMREVNLVGYRPSAIAAAAALVALDQSLMKDALESKMNPISCHGFLETEDVFQCYDLMRQIGMENLESSVHLKSPDISPSRLNAMNNLENSSFTMIKRKRLTFDSPSEDHDLPAGKRL